MHFLNDQERTQLKIQHKQERDGRVRDRIKAVLLYDKGWSSQQIAEALFISDQAVRNHIDDYKTSSKLNPESGGSNEKLSQKQSDQLVVHLREHTYLYVKDIVAYVQATFGIIYTVPGMRTWLQRHEFSYKKPAVVPGKANKEQQQEWLAAYEKLRQGLSGVIDVVSHNVVIQEDQTLNAESTIRFFQKIEEAYPCKRRVHVFCDNAPYYRNKAVSQYLTTSKIACIFCLPTVPI